MIDTKIRLIIFFAAKMEKLYTVSKNTRQVPLDVGLPEGAAADAVMEQGHRGLRAGLPGPWHTVGAWEMFVEMKLKCRKRELKEL